MVDTVEIQQAGVKLSNGIQLASTAQDIFEQAIAFCARQMDIEDLDEVVGLLRTGNRAASEYCSYALARHAAAFLGSVDGHITAAYGVDYDILCEGECSPPLRQDIPILHLILHTERKTAALDSLIAALDRALAHHYARLFDQPQIQSLLDVQVVDEADIIRRAWPATLLHAVYHPPLQLWQR